jgi:OmpA-OmpF porin, OOP family
MAHLPDTRFAARLLALALLALTFACSPLSQLKRAQQDDRGDFRSNLASEYLAFAESEAELGHGETSAFFARKGLRAARDHATPPESPADWDMDADTRTELHNARQRLMQVRSDFFQRVASHSLARAQMLYDCWVMQSAKRTDDDLSLPCRGEFLGELGKLEQVRATLGPNPKVELPAHYTILFDMGSADLDKDAAFTIQEVLAVTRLNPHHTLSVTGHADRVGSQSRNLQLSRQRADKVTEALVEAGIDRERIDHSADGEDNPATPTLDGVARERNRRVEISVMPLMQAPLEMHGSATKAAPHHEGDDVR